MMAEDQFLDDDMSRFYTRRAPETTNESGGTRVLQPGEMAGIGGDEPAQESDEALSVRRLCGIVFSVSAGEGGEMWPLYEGMNTVGRMSGCDVQLGEASVDNLHAELEATISGDGLKVTLCDLHTKFGTMRNGEKLDGGTVTLADRDILTFGQNYELVLLLADVQKLGLAPRPDFSPVAEEPLSEIPEISDMPEEEDSTAVETPAFDDPANGTVVKTGRDKPLFDAAATRIFGWKKK